MDKIYIQKEGTWCEDRINDDDVEYIRADQAEKEFKQEKLGLLNQLSFLVDSGMYLEFAIERLQKEIKEDK